jgi:hypothetical protein
MRTKQHWEACKNLPSYHSAQSVAQQLKEIARGNGFDPNGVKVYTKEQADTQGSIADAQVRWAEGPEWTQDFQLVSIPGVHAEVENEHTISFYDI